MFGVVKKRLLEPDNRTLERSCSLVFLLQLCFILFDHCALLVMLLPQLPRSTSCFVTDWQWHYERDSRTFRRRRKSIWRGGQECLLISISLYRPLSHEQLYYLSYTYCQGQYVRVHIHVGWQTYDQQLVNYRTLLPGVLARGELIYSVVAQTQRNARLAKPYKSKKDRNVFLEQLWLLAAKWIMRSN